MDENPNDLKELEANLLEELKGLSPTPKNKPLIQDEEIKDLLRKIFQRLRRIDEKQEKIVEILDHLDYSVSSLSR